MFGVEISQVIVNNVTKHILFLFVMKYPGTNKFLGVTKGKLFSAILCALVPDFKVG